jgi:rRNA maturation endonuclease Nob1
MKENYIQYASGYQKDNIDETDISKAIADIQLKDDEHGAFWVSIITDDENVIEVNKDLTLSLIFERKETKHRAKDWKEVSELYRLLLNEKFDEIAMRVKYRTPNMGFASSGGRTNFELCHSNKKQ